MQCTCRVMTLNIFRSITSGKQWLYNNSQLCLFITTVIRKLIYTIYKKVNSMRERDQPYCPITTIKYVQGQIITDKHQVKQRWGGFFEELLNPNEDTRYNNFSAQDILEHEPEILRSEVEESLKSAKTGKAPGIDGISIEIIKAA